MSGELSEREGGGHEPLDVASSEVVQNRVYLPWSWYTGLPYREDRGGGIKSQRKFYLGSVYTNSNGCDYTVGV